ncbi:Chitin-binding, domain 3 [Ophiocordyceps camponoti-floridani]|uniref:Chitin-binding, domain 3 n=1 Tax=Ophiocordyceps camponoti-floridani TaxID=2030778 RepID=A0A8H4VCH1_9HYPO|nr:Chitin-binding, domain 3 [Ophiocordyceps camponoti-floridani]
MLVQALALAGLAASASAHILISNPVPYGKDSLNNSPLLADGSDFPCKQRTGVYDTAGASNVYKQGSTQQLEFRGSAVHGGGSCQVSLTTDLKPTKNSVWKVIKSIEGGCPAKNQGGNMGGGAGADTPFKYDFTIPSELASGNYTLAWTWFNKIGNREMYMNCAPVSVTGSGGSGGFLNSLPDMFVANLGKGGCGTKEGTDVQFPNPGKDVDRFNGATSAFAPPVGSCPTGSSDGGNGGYQPPAPTKAAKPEQDTPVQPTQTPSAGNGPPIPQASNSVPGAVFATVSADSPKAPAPTSDSSPPSPQTSPCLGPPRRQRPPNAPAEPPSQQPPPPSQQPPAGPSNGTAPAGVHPAGTSCSPEGTWNCIAGKSFQRCASGMWSVPQDMAAGTACAPGEAPDLKMSAASVRRSLGRRFRYVA